MQEITLTGGTMMSDNNNRNSGHSHSHGHSHGHSHHHEQGQAGIEMMETPSLDDILEGSTEDIGQSLFTLLRFGRYEALERLMEQLSEKKSSELKDILLQSDDGGHNILHWAAKRVDDLRFLQLLLATLESMDLSRDENLLHLPSKDNVGMYPSHWSCTEDGSIPHIALLLQKGANMEARDASGCTPLLIAAQYGQVEVVAYLLKQGANLQAVDSSHDTALHWAAYKGSIQVCGLLTFYPTLRWNTTDAYGQTPLHLASLRGHTSVVRYILHQLDKPDILFLKDKNERTPLDLAIHKNRPTVEQVLRDAMAKLEDPRGFYLRKTLWSNLMDCLSWKSWKAWMGMSAGMDEMDEPVRFPFYYVIANFVLHLGFLVFVFCPLSNAEAGLLWDRSFLLLCYVVTAVVSWYFFYKTWKTAPGYLDNSLPGIEQWRQRYEETLEAYADETKIKDLPPLCHTCHIARPLRSKHCRVQRKCVLLFDHYCPFVDNTIGLYNYKYFFWFLFSMTCGLLIFAITLIIYLKRYMGAGHGMPWMTLLVGLEVAMTMIPVGGMLLYHTQLAMVNLSTNEHLNVRKYTYLYPSVKGRRTYKNPWFKGWMGNFMDRMHPSEKSYMIAVEREALTDNIV